MPTMGRASASSERPIAFTNALRRKSEKSASPYDVKPFFIPLAVIAEVLRRRSVQGRGWGRHGRLPPSHRARSPYASSSMPDLVADPQEMQAHGADDRQAGGDHSETQPWRDVTGPEEAVAEAIDHVEERVEVAHLVPDRRQRLHRVEHAREERHRHDDEVLEGRDLVELLRPQARDQAERSHERGAGDREERDPEHV